MAYFDISIPISATTPAWPGDTPYTCGWTCRTERGDSVNLASVTTSLHVGTHADAPVHVHHQWPASESLPASAFVGNATVISVKQHIGTDDEITAELLQTLLGDHVVARILVHTGCSVASGAFPNAWPVLTTGAAQWLIHRGVVLFGTDAPSVDRLESKDLPIHHALFDGGTYLIENLVLDAVAPGHYELLAQPLAILGADAAPLRALLRALT